MFCSVSVFASNLTERNVYGLISENFTGAMQECGYDVDNIRFLTWSGGGAAQPSCSDPISDVTAKEGKAYYRLTCGSVGSGAWAGCGYGFINASKADNPQNISRFKYLDFWIRKVSGNISQLQIGVKAGGANRLVSLSGKVDNSSTDWQHVVIDITSIATSAQLQDTLIPFLVDCANLTAQTKFDIDNVVLRTDSSSANFNITLKKVEDMQGAPDNPTQITWTEFSGWQAAAQYVEIDADKYSCAWTVRVWVNNGAANRNGLWAQGTEKEYVIPMCFRVYNGYLYNFIESPAGEASYLIGQSAASHHNLYDRGVNPNTDPGYYPWLWMKEYREINFANQEDVDSITIWDSTRGYHVAYPFDWTSGGKSGHSDGFVDFTGVDKTLRVYLGAGFGGAAGGITYTANVVFDLNYE